MPKDSPRAVAIKNLMAYLHKSEAGRFAPKPEAQEPKAEEAQESGMSAETVEALQSLVGSKGE